MPRENTKLRPRIYALRMEIQADGKPRSWRKIGKLMGLPEATVRWHFNQYTKDLDEKLEGQKAMSIAIAVENGSALDFGLTERISTSMAVEKTLEKLYREFEAATDAPAICGLSAAMYQYLKFKQKHLESGSSVVASEEMMQVFIEVLTNESDEIRNRILTGVIDRLGEGLKQFWSLPPEGPN